MWYLYSEFRYHLQDSKRINMCKAREDSYKIIKKAYYVRF